MTDSEEFLSLGVTLPIEAGLSRPCCLAPFDFIAKSRPTTSNGKRSVVDWFSWYNYDGYRQKDMPYLPSDRGRKGRSAVGVIVGEG